MVSCQYCDAVLDRNASLVSHLSNFHRNKYNLVIPCSVEGCPSSFKHFSTLRGHLARVHRVAKVDLVIDQVEPVDGQGVEVDVINDGVDNIDNEREDQAEAEEIPNHTDNFSKDVAASFLLNLKSHNITERVMDIVVENIQTLVRACVTEFKEEVTAELKSHSLDLNNYLDVTAAVDRVCNIFDGTSTKGMRNKASKKNLHLVEAERIKLNEVIVRGPQPDMGSNRTSRVANETLMYVPLIQSIQKFLANPHFLELLKPLEPSEDKVLASYADGSKYRESEFIGAHPSALKIVVYSDDVNLVDTASTRPVKMTFYYLSFLDIHPQYRSLVRNISLLMAVESDTMKRASVGEVIKPLLSDLKLLEGGIRGPNDREIFATLFGLLGDNLAIHQNAGFKEGFTAECSCRYCLVTKATLRILTFEDQTLLRTIEQYNDTVAKMKQCAEVIENPQASSRERKDAKDEWEELSKTSGINREAEWNELETYHVIGGTPPDPYHDLVLGGLARHLQLLLRHYLIGAEGSHKIMTLTAFNEQMTGLDYGYSETKPSVVLESHLREGNGLHQTGAQMWSLAVTVVPFVIGPVVSFDDPHWKNYLSLLEIMSLVFAHKISLGMVALMQFSIDEYLSDFMTLYNTHLIPKQHYLIHYPRLTLLYGPLGQYSTARFEAKHQFFKDLMKKYRCMKNPAFTAANQHQLFQGNLMTGPMKQLNKQGPVVKKALCSTTYQAVLPPGIAEILSVPWVELNGITYKTLKCFVMVGYKTPLPQFALIHDIIYVENEFVFVCQMYETTEFTFHFNAYKVSSRDEYKLYQLKDFFCHETFHAHILHYEKFIAVRRSVGDLY